MVEEPSPLLPLAEESIEEEAESDATAPEPTSEPGFVCDCEGFVRSACEGLPFYKEHENQRYCVLHYPGKAKSADFKTALDSKLSDKDFDLRGVWFPTELWEFWSRDFDALVMLDHAVFSANVRFSKTTFCGQASFSDATFSGDADFTDTTFRASVDFSKTRFSKSDFSGAKFLAESHFTNTVFTERADFSSSRFEGAAFFTSSTFKGEAFFFRGWFEMDAIFSDASFLGNVSFSMAHFSKDALFLKAAFGGDVDFQGALFNRQPYFIEAEFKGRSTFASAFFRGGADFRQCNFNGTADFAFAQFGSVAVFVRAMFGREAVFSGAVFSADAFFAGSAFKDYVRFSGEDSRPFNTESLVGFQHSRIDRPDRVYFYVAALRPHWFIGADVRNFNFIDVKWIEGNVEEEILRTKKLIVPDSNESPKFLLSKVYRELASNAEANNRYEEASRFRYSAMECRRQEQWTGFSFWKRCWNRALAVLAQSKKYWIVSLFTRNWLHWSYWVFSGYGERICLAFLWLLAVWIVFAALYTWVGFTEELTFPRTLTYSLAVMSLQKPEPRPLTNWAHTLVTLETILGPVQAALLALAIRRKFMR